MKSSALSGKVGAIFLGLFMAALLPWAGLLAHTNLNGVGNQPRGVAWRVNIESRQAIDSEGWVDRLTGFVVVQRGISKTEGEGLGFDPYFGQLTLVRTFYARGDWSGAYLAMNRFMDMLEAREGGIADRAADAIWNYCYEVTPPALHDVKRHRQWWNKHVEWDKFFWEE